MKRWKVTAPNGRIYSVYANTDAQMVTRCNAAKIAKPRTTEPAGTYNRARNVIENGGDE